MKRLLVIVAVLAALIGGSWFDGHNAQAAQVGDGGGYVYAFPSGHPYYSTIRNMLKANCVPIVYPTTWACPDAPPYTYGS